MRLWLLLTVVLASVVNGSPGSTVVDLHGTTRSGDRPELPPQLPPHRSTALDGAITYSIRHD